MKFFEARFQYDSKIAFIAMRVASYIATSEQMTDDFPYIDRSLLPTIAFKLDAAGGGGYYFSLSN